MKISRALFLLSLALLAGPLRAECDAGTAIVVRHGEKFLTGDEARDRDAPLAVAGIERSAALAALLSDAGVDAVYSSDFARTRGTVEPLARQLGLPLRLYPVREADAQKTLATRVMSEACGQEVLIAGHSNTVPELLAAFGVAAPGELADSQYDRLFVVHWRRGAPAQLLTLRYGRPTP